MGLCNDIHGQSLSVNLMNCNDPLFMHSMCNNGAAVYYTPISYWTSIVSINEANNEHSYLFFQGQFSHLDRPEEDLFFSPMDALIAAMMVVLTLF